MDAGALERYEEFLRSEPIESILSRNLGFLLYDNELVSAVKLDTSLKNRTEGGQVILGGVPYLLRPDFDRRHWTAGLRVLLAHEVQHDNSSDSDALKRVCEFSERLFEERGFRPFVGRILGQRVMNILEDARVNNIICCRFSSIFIVENIYSIFIYANLFAELIISDIFAVHNHIYKNRIHCRTAQTLC